MSNPNLNNPSDSAAPHSNNSHLNIQMLSVPADPLLDAVATTPAFAQNDVQLASGNITPPEKRAARARKAKESSVAPTDSSVMSYSESGPTRRSGSVQVAAGGGPLAPVSSRESSVMAGIKRKERESSPADDDLEPMELTKKEKRHKEFNERLEKHARDFYENREKIYHETLSSLKTELLEAQNGTHPLLSARIAQLRAGRDSAIDRAHIMRQYALECARAMYEMEVEGAMEEYNREKSSLKFQMLTALEERRRRLKEDRDSFDLSNPAAVEATIETHKNMGIRKQTRANTQKHAAAAVGSLLGFGYASLLGDGTVSGGPKRTKKGVTGQLCLGISADEINDDLRDLRRHKSGRK